MSKKATKKVTKEVVEPVEENVLDIEALKAQPTRFRSRTASHEVKIGEALFYVKPLTSFLIAAISENQTTDGEMDNLGMALEMVRFGLDRVENLLDEDDNEVTLSTEKVKIAYKVRDAVTIDFLEALDMHVIVVLGSEIGKLSTLTTEEKTRVDFSTPSSKKG